MRFIYPLDEIRITQEFGADPEFYGTLEQKGHNGIDLGCVSGTPVKASGDGIIEFEGWGNATWGGSAAGVFCVINHGDVYTGYAHLQSTIVNKGQSVKQGQIIGYADSTGLSTGNHLHFEFIGKPTNWGNGYAGRVNPSNYLNKGEEDVKMDKTQAYYHALGIYGIDWDDATLAKTGYIGMDYIKGTEFMLDYANKNGIAYWQYKAKAEKTIADLNKQVTDLQNQPPQIVTKEVEKIVTKEVPMGFDDLSIGELLSEAFKKLFHIK